MFKSLLLIVVVLSVWSVYSCDNKNEVDRNFADLNRLLKPVSDTKLSYNGDCTCTWSANPIAEGIWRVRSTFNLKNITVLYRDSKGNIAIAVGKLDEVAIVGHNIEFELGEKRELEKKLSINSILHLTYAYNEVQDSLYHHLKQIALICNADFKEEGY
jgi:hypothetical protein